MIVAAEAQGVTLMVGYMKRYDPGYEYAQQIFQAMEGVRLIRVHDLTGRGRLAPQEIYSLHHASDLAPEIRARLQAETHARMAQGIDSDDPQIIRAYGMMRGLSSHDMTVLRGAFGDPVAIGHAEVLSDGQFILAVLEYANDVRCVWEIGNIPQATRNWFDEELTVYDSAQTVSIQFPNPYVRYARSHVHVQAMDGAAHTSNTIVSLFDEAFRCEWLHFHDCVPTGIAPRTGAADALRDIEILRAIMRCAADGAPVRL